METSVIRSEKDNSLVNNICSGCTLPIIDPCLSKVLDKLWHDRCLRCCECQVILRDKCFARDSNLYCKQDFYRIYGVQCSGCDEGIFPSDLVRRIGQKFFHMTCLKCCRCNKEVSTGDQLYILEDGTFLCKSDYESQITKTKIKLSLKTPKVEPDSDADDDHQSHTPYVNGENPVSDEDDEPNRRRGPRTTIKAKQLDVLKAAFLSTPKPSKHIREQLAQDTGLTMRVIQVWFQNRRSKERRVKQLPPAHDPGRAIRKNTNEEANDVSYPFYPNTVFPQAMDGWFNQQGFRFFNNSVNLEHSGNNKPDTKTKSIKTFNNINKNIMRTMSSNNNSKNIHTTNTNTTNSSSININNINNFNNNNFNVIDYNSSNNLNNINNINAKNNSGNNINNVSNNDNNISSNIYNTVPTTNINMNTKNCNNSKSDNDNSNNNIITSTSTTSINNTNNCNNNSENKNDNKDNNVSSMDIDAGVAQTNTDVHTGRYIQLYTHKQTQAINHTQSLQGVKVLATAE